MFSHAYVETSGRAILVPRPWQEAGIHIVEYKFHMKYRILILIMYRLSYKLCCNNQAVAKILNVNHETGNVYIEIRFGYLWLYELLLVDNYHVNRHCSHHMADSHQLRGPGDTWQLSDFLSNLLHKVVIFCPVE